MNNIILSILCFVLLGGCSHLAQVVPPDIKRAEPLEQSSDYSLLKSLPTPMGSIPVSVYSFRDQTGQYKPIANVSSFSTAVTQGATAILVQALNETDWFIPIEREGLQNI